MKYYYAIFTETEEGVETEFPDIPGCMTFGDTYDEAYQNVLEQVDRLRRLQKLNRSAILIRAVEEYMKNHEAVSEQAGGIHYNKS